MGCGVTFPGTTKPIYAPHESRVALREGDWKIVANETLEKVQLYHIQKDWREEHDLAEKMPEKTAELKTLLLKTWDDIKKEGPHDWWESTPVQPNMKQKGSTLAY